MGKHGDGGSAFPIPAGGKDGYGNPTNQPRYGMTMRDYFANSAPVDWSMAQQAAGLGVTVSPTDRLTLWAAMAIMRYEYADAMLAERAKGGA